MSAAEWFWNAVSTEPFSFLIGGVAGFLIADRWRITRRNEKDRDDRDRQ